jgi:hypothetical protein
MLGRGTTRHKNDCFQGNSEFPPPSVIGVSEQDILMGGARRIEIGRDAVGNTIITGDGNVVVIEAVRRLPDPQAAPTRLGPNPYKGLAAFDEDDGERFFGREALTGKLWEALLALHAPLDASPPLRLLAVVGPSGCGKSSVVRAGLLPELARRPLPGLERSRVAVLTPGAHPAGGARHRAGSYRDGRSSAHRQGARIRRRTEETPARRSAAHR